MVRKAVDVVLLPAEAMSDKAIEANEKLVEKFASRIVLNKQNCLPHISLAMGCIDESDIGTIERVLTQTAEKYPVGTLKVVGIGIGTDSVGEKVSSFEIEKTEQLQLLHEMVMQEMSPYFNYEVSADLLYGDEDIARSTLLWIKYYREKSGFDNFWPHITLGYGRLDKICFPEEFAVSSIALCHLGNHCTCRKVLISIKLNI